MFGRNLREANPTASAIGEIVEGAGVMMVPGSRWLELGAVAQGAMLGAGSSLSRQSLYNEVIDPKEIAKSALTGAVIGGALSLWRARGWGLSASAYALLWPSGQAWMRLG